MDKSVLKQATNDKPEPTPGHLQREVAKMTFSDLKVSQKVLDFLLDRLSSGKNVHQLAKTLKVIKHCAQYGHPDFQKSMQKRADELRTYSNYRGSLDPEHGDKLNQAVRDAAREAIEAIFSSQPKSKITNSLEGMGGNTRDPSALEKERFQAEVKIQQPSNKLAEAIAKKGEKNAGVLGGLKGMLGLGDTMPEHHKAMLKKMEELQQQQSYGPPVNETTLNAPSTAPSGAPKWGFLAAGAEQSTVTVKDEEVVLSPAQKLVEQYVNKSSTPGRSDVTKFVRAAQALMESDELEDEEEVAARLDDKLCQKMPWQTRLNTLTLIEALLKAGCEPVRSFFTESPEDIMRNVNVVQSTVKEKAKKVLAELGLPEQVAHTKAPPAQQLSMPATSQYVDPTAAVSAPVASGTATEPSGRKEKKEGTKGLKKRGRKSAPATETAEYSAPAGEDGGDLFNMLQVRDHTNQEQLLQLQQQQEAQKQLLQQQQEELRQRDMMLKQQQLQMQLQQQQQQLQQQQQQLQQQQPPATPPQPTNGNVLDGLFGTPIPSSNPAPTPNTTPAAQGTSLNDLDIFGMPADTTPKQARPTSLNNVDLAGMGGLGQNSPSVGGVGGLAPTPAPSPMTAQTGNSASAAKAAEMLAQLQLQQQQLQMQIAALQQQQQPQSQQPNLLLGLQQQTLGQQQHTTLPQPQQLQQPFPYQQVLQQPQQPQQQKDVFDFVGQAMAQMK